MPALELLCEVAEAGGSGLVAVLCKPSARVPEPCVGVEAVPARELDGVAFEHGPEPPEGTATLDRFGQPCCQVVVIDGADEPLQVAVGLMRSLSEQQQPAGFVAEVDV